MVSNNPKGRSPEIIMEREEEYRKKGQKLFNCSNDQIWVTGILDKEFEYSHETKGTKFYSSTVMITRTSDVVDHIPILVSEDKISNGEFKKYTAVKVAGSLRTLKTVSIFNFIQASLLEKDEDESRDTDENILHLQGFVSNPPHFVKTKLGKKILYIVLEVSIRGRRSYISCMLWDNKAEKAKDEIEEGDKVEVYGSVQSRIHRMEDKERPGKDIEITKYEISVCKYNIMRKNS